MSGHRRLPIRHHRRIAEVAPPRRSATGVFPRGSHAAVGARARRATSSVSRGTVRQALASAPRRGRRSRRAGRARRRARGAARAELLRAPQLLGLGARRSARTRPGRVVELARRYADADDARRLDVLDGDPVFSLVRVRHARRHVPVMVERTTFVESGRRGSSPPSTCSSDSIYARSARSASSSPTRGTPSTRSPRTRSTPDLLDVPAGTPLLRQTRRTTLARTAGRSSGRTTATAATRCRSSSRTAAARATLPGSLGGDGD